MIARGFKPVAWVGAVGVAALCCYMLSLQVAAERAELTSLERKIISTQRSIRSLQTELGTRARVTQLQQWNDEILALAPPEAGQFLESQITLARFDARGPALSDQAEVRMASAEVPATTPAPAAPAAAPQPQRAVAGARPAQPQLGQDATVQRASLTLPARPNPATSVPARAEPRAAAPAATRKPVPPTRTVSAEPVRRAAPAPAPARPRALLDERTVRDLGTAARAERRGGTRN